MKSVLSRRSLVAGSLAVAGVLAGRPTFALADEAPAGGGAVGGAATIFIRKTPEGRAVEVTQWLPRGKAKGTILFSHGAGSAPRHYARVVGPWVEACWRVLAPLHVDSREHPQTADYPGLASWKARIEDMRVLVAEMGRQPFVAAGHSYGGLVALTLGGANPVAPQGMALPLVPRLASAVIAFSPPAPVPVLVTAEGYGTLAVPAFIETGTRDLFPGPGGAIDPEAWKGHLVPFDASAPGGKRYGLLLDGADHYFGGAICDPARPGPRQLAQLDLANRYAGLFLAAFGAGDATARAELDARVSDALPARLMAK